jgi:hypothetical protein
MHAASLNLVLSAGRCFEDDEYSQRHVIAKTLPAETLDVFPALLTKIFVPSLPPGYIDTQVRREYFGQLIAPNRYRGSQRHWDRQWAYFTETLGFGQNTDPEPRADAVLPACMGLVHTAGSWFKIAIRGDPAAPSIISSYYSVDPYATINRDSQSGEDVFLRDYISYFDGTGAILPNPIPVDEFDKPPKFGDNNYLVM